MRTEEDLSRQIAFLGAAGQAVVQKASVAVIGTGGVGSLLAEGLARLGVGEIMLVDPDRLEASNLNRFVGAGPSDIGIFKTEVVKNNLARATPNVRVTSIPKSLYDLDDEFLGAQDCTFCATDDQVTRHVVNRRAAQWLTPLIDVGTAIRTRSGVDFLSRVSVVIPGTTACLECSVFRIFEGHEIADAYASTGERSLFRHSGYVQDRPDIITPSVMALNMVAAGQALQEFLNLLFAWRPVSTNLYTEWASGHLQRADRTSLPERPDPACPCCGNYLGAGASEQIPKPKGASIEPAE